MDYEKKYKEAFERAKECHTDGLSLHQPVKDVIEYIFPELKESEDERIRKELIEQVIYIVPNSDEVDSEGNVLPTHQKRIDKYRAWLEKQGGQKSIWHNENEEPQRGSLILLIMQSGTPIVAKIIEPNHTFNHGERWAYIDDLLENQGGQKPKFKVGDWCIDNEDGTIFQIVKVLDNTYTYKTNEGKEYSCTHYSLENDARLWDITKDAKPGDVLTCYSDIKGQPIEQTGIIKQYVGRHGGCSNSFEAYIGVDWDGNIITDGYMGSSDIYPATKEQRDALERAITNAGYRWDKEKLKLEKI